MRGILEAIEESDEISEPNRELIREYRRDKELGGMSAATQQRNLSYIKILGERVGDASFRDFEADDMKEIVEWLSDRDLTDETIDTYKKVIQSFWNWMYETEGHDEHPEPIAWITLNRTRGNGTLPKDLLTKEDIERQANATKNDRDRAFIWMLYETGARIGELIDLTVGDIEDRQQGKKVVIDGKTGQRRLPLVESVPALNKWLNSHPNPEKDAPLWCKLQSYTRQDHEDGELKGAGRSGDQLGYRYIRDKILQKNMDRAGIDKPSNPHHYRHSRASYLANHLKEAQLCVWFGWVQGSDVPARYVHLSGRDIDNAYDEMHGIREPDEEEEEPSVQECWRCEELNSPRDTYCGSCGAPLDSAAVYQAEEVQQQGEEMVLEVSSDVEAKILRSIQKEIRENPEKYLST